MKANRTKMLGTIALVAVLCMQLFWIYNSFQMSVHQMGYDNPWSLAADVRAHAFFSALYQSRITLLMLYGSMPMLGFIIAYYALMSYLGIHFMPKEMSQFGFFQLLPLMLVGTFISAYVFYGAILEELLKSGKKKWVVLLVYLLMIMPTTLTAGSGEGMALWIFYVLAALPCTLYGFWLYCKTRSSIVIFAVYLISNMIPFNLGSNWVIP
jgi:hypothetical protein